MPKTLYRIWKARRSGIVYTVGMKDGRMKVVEAKYRPDYWRFDGSLLLLSPALHSAGPRGLRVRPIKLIWIDRGY